MTTSPSTDLSDEELVRRCKAELPHTTSSGLNPSDRTLIEVNFSKMS